MDSIYEKITCLFDPLHHYWEHERLHRKISTGLALFFLLSITVIEFHRQGILPAPLTNLVPDNHFLAIETAFTVVLILEVISLVFTIPCSFSRSVGKQFELLSLILLRNAFKELSTFTEPISFLGYEESICHILADGFGALAIFALLGWYYHIQRPMDDDKMQKVALYHFVTAKKGISLVLLIIFSYMGIRAGYRNITGTCGSDFLHEFYTVLVLADILVVLISQCFQPSFYAVFRNSGLALSTLIIRIALAAPPVYNVLLGLAAAVFTILLTYTNRIFYQKNFTPHPIIQKEDNP